MTINDITKNFGKDDAKFITDAYIFATTYHKGQKRSSGENYIIHPLSVANLTYSILKDPASIVTALLHDVVEDTSAIKEDIKQRFGIEVSEMVDALTKINLINYHSNEEAQANNFRKMVVAMAKDMRVIIIKICDRLHNMRTLQYLIRTKQLRIAKETIDIYAPLAHRLGMGSIKSELEDLSLKYLKSDEYYTIARELQEKRIDRETHIDAMVTRIKELMDNSKIEYRIEGRAKHIYSIYKKMEKNGIDINNISEIYDLFAVRIIVLDIKTCYTVLGIVHSHFKLVPGRFKDYISLPKANMYQSLHTTVFGSSARVVEVQIRTEDMDNIAKNGIAAHWRYKEGGKFNLQDKRFVWMKHILQWQKDMIHPKEFMGSMKMDLVTDEIYVFTPDGDLKVLPRGSTSVDFAYSIHTAVGDKCTGALINGKMTPLKSQLKTGNIVSILTSNNHHPSKDWLSFVKTSKAKNKIRQWIRTKERASSVMLGRELIENRLKGINLSLSEYAKSKETEELIKKIERNTIEDVYMDVGNGKLSVASAVKHLYKSQKDKNKLQEHPKGLPSIPIVIDGVYLDKVMVNFAKCCTPVPGDEIVGFITRGRGMTIHRTKCPNFEKLSIEEGRLVNVRWKTAAKVFPVSITVVTKERVGMLAKLSSITSSRGINIINVSMITNSMMKTTTVKFILEISSNKQINDLIRVLQSLENVLSVKRLME